MQIHGLNKLTLLDYPGHMACLVFTGSCNYRCPFCQNSSLVLNPSSQPLISEKEILDFLKMRSGILEGICISGGEPTLQPDLEDFIRKVRSLGYLVKLDTNGSRPDTVNTLLSQGLLDYVAMDIKNTPEKYAATAGLMHRITDSGSPSIAADNFITASVRKTAMLLMNSDIAYEFRTTLVREFHTKQDLLEIGGWLQGADMYYLQSFRDTDTLVGAPMGTFHAFSKEELLSMKELLRPYFKRVELRGID